LEADRKLEKKKKPLHTLAKQKERKYLIGIQL
jgi:hypothetical protein